MKPVRLNSNGNYWQATWYTPSGQRRKVSLGSKDKLTERDALTKCQEIATQHANDPATVVASAPERVTLSTLQSIYAKERTQTSANAAIKRGYRKGAVKLHANTVDSHLLTIRYMVQHFGSDRLLTSIDDNAAEVFIAALEAGELAAAKLPGVRPSDLGPQSIRKHIRQAKAIFNWAQLRRFIRLNPFRDFDGTVLKSNPNANVAAATVEQIIDACTTHEWRCLFALCRFAGLRLGEALALPWTGEAIDKQGELRRVGIDMLHRRIHLVADKTGMYRVVPMTPRLYQIIADAKADAASDTKVCGSLNRNTIHEQARARLAIAGIKPWPKLFQALRSSCENEWKASGVAEATYTAWLGHGIAVSRAHYVAPTEAEFERVTQLRLAS